MKILTLAATTLLLASGAAFADGGDHGPGWNFPASTIDTSRTSSTNNADATRPATPPRTIYRPAVPAIPGDHVDHWGNR